jgi:hypothetical protein
MLSERDNALAARAGSKPCPWCGNLAGYRSGTGKETLAMQALAIPQTVVALLTSPRKLVVSQLRSHGVVKYCRGCAGRVEICPACDTPVRSQEAVYTCKNCGNEFTS